VVRKGAEVGGGSEEVATLKFSGGEGKAGVEVGGGGGLGPS